MALPYQSNIYAKQVEVNDHPSNYFVKPADRKPLNEYEVYIKKLKENSG